MPLSREGFGRIQKEVMRKTLGLERELIGKSQGFSRAYGSMLAETKEIYSRKNPPLIQEIRYLLLCWRENFNELMASLPKA